MKISSSFAATSSLLRRYSATTSPQLRRYVGETSPRLLFAQERLSGYDSLLRRFLTVSSRYFAAMSPLLRRYFAVTTSPQLRRYFGAISPRLLFAQERLVGFDTLLRRFFEDFEQLLRRYFAATSPQLRHNFGAASAGFRRDRLLLRSVWLVSTHYFGIL